MDTLVSAETAEAAFNLFYSPRNPTRQMQRLANRARKMAAGRAVLYHGTRYPNSILQTGVLFRILRSAGKVSFTRSPEVAAYFAVRPNDFEERRGAILVFDRNALACRYAIAPAREPAFFDEAEEEVWANIVNISRYLIGHISTKERNELRKLSRRQLRRDRQALRRRAAEYLLDDL
jgi:hypothetical protein